VFFFGLFFLLKGALSSAFKARTKELQEQLGQAERDKAEGLAQTSDGDAIARLVSDVLSTYPDELASYLTGKETLANWFFGQVMKAASGKANPAVLKSELEKQLQQYKSQAN